MDNFEWCNPTRIVFGKGEIARLRDLVPAKARTLLLYGGGSIKKNGVYAQVKKALARRPLAEFGGIEANPEYATCLEAARVAKKERATFLLAVGGGSVMDATKFIAAAVPFAGGDPWDLVEKQLPLKAALPLGCVVTLPATGSEANPNAVISNRALGRKKAMASDLVRPVFSILDPETTYTLGRRQTANGVVDSFVHVCEQYVSRPVHATTQGRQAEALLSALVDIGPRVLKAPKSYDWRADLMYAAWQALNFHLACGVPGDWATHGIGHELTALYGLDHALTLAIVQPELWRFDFKRKKPVLAQMGRRVWGLSGGADAVARAAIDRTDAFYRSLGLKNTLREQNIPADAPARVRANLEKGGRVALGEYGDLTPDKVETILQRCARR